MSVARTVLSVSAAVLTTAAVAILVWAFFQAWRNSRKARVDISTVADATGDRTTKDTVLGLTHLLREEVLTALPRLADRMKHEIDDAKADPTSPLATLVRDDVAIEKRLVGDIGSSQQELTESITTLAPETARGAVRVITETVLRPRGVRVSGVLQRVNDAPGGVGLSFCVDQLQGAEATRRVTLWEDGDTDTSGKTVVERFYDLMVPASRSLACELLRQHLTARARKRRPGDVLRGRHADLRGREAVIDFMVGTAYLSAAARYAPATMSFYQQAERALTNTATLDHYRVPYVRAEALAQRARREGPEEAVNLLQGSIALLEEARKKLPRARLDDPRRTTADLNIRASLAVVRCLLVDRLPDEPWRAKAAASAIADLQEVDTSPLEHSPSLQDSTVLYNLASAFAVASALDPLADHGVDLQRCLRRAKECLLYACLGSEQWWTDGKADPDLRLLQPWMLDARRQVLATGGEAPLDRDAVCAIVSLAVGAEAPKSERLDRAHENGRPRAEATGAPR